MPRGVKRPLSGPSDKYAADSPEETSFFAEGQPSSSTPLSSSRNDSLSRRPRQSGLKNLFSHRPPVATPDKEALAKKLWEQLTQTLYAKNSVHRKPGTRCRSVGQQGSKASIKVDGEKKLPEKVPLSSGRLQRIEENRDPGLEGVEKTPCKDHTAKLKSRSSAEMKEGEKSRERSCPTEETASSHADTPESEESGEKECQSKKFQDSFPNSQVNWNPVVRLKRLPASIGGGDEKQTNQMADGEGLKLKAASLTPGKKNSSSKEDRKNDEHEVGKGNPSNEITECSVGDMPATESSNDQDEDAVDASKGTESCAQKLPSLKASKYGSLSSSPSWLKLLARIRTSTPDEDPELYAEAKRIFEAWTDAPASQQEDSLGALSKKERTAVPEKVLRAVSNLTNGHRSEEGGNRLKVEVSSSQTQMSQLHDDGKRAGASIGKGIVEKRGEPKAYGEKPLSERKVKENKEDEANSSVLQSAAQKIGCVGDHSENAGADAEGKRKKRKRQTEEGEDSVKKTEEAAMKTLDTGGKAKFPTRMGNHEDPSCASEEKERPPRKDTSEALDAEQRVRALPKKRRQKTMATVGSRV